LKLSLSSLDNLSTASRKEIAPEEAKESLKKLFGWKAEDMNFLAF